MKAWAITTLLCTAVAATASAQPAGRPLHLVVPFDNASGEPRVDWLSEGSALLLTDDLAALGVSVIRREDRLRAFNRLRVPPVAALSHATVIRVGEVVGAAEIVIGSFAVNGTDLTVRARHIRLDSGRMSAEVVERGGLQDLLDIHTRLARRLVTETGIAAEPRAPAPPGYSRLPVFEQYVKGLLAAAPAAQVSFLSQALALDPRFQQARLALWEVHTALGEHKTALEVIRQVPPGSPFSRQARFLAGISMLNLGQSATAFDTFIALNREMPDPALLNNIGVAQLRRATGPSTSLGTGPSTSLGTGGKGVSYFGEAIALDGSDPDLFFNLGYGFWLDKDPQGAVYWLREAVRRDPADDEAHYALGVALQATGATAEAAREKELARRLSSIYAGLEARQPGVNVMPRGLERVKLELDVPASLRIDEAVVAAEQRDQRAVAEFHFENGRRFFDAGRDADAIGELRRTIFLAPYDSRAHLLLGRIYLRSGRVQDAIDALTIAAWSDPANREAQDLLESLK